MSISSLHNVDFYAWTEQQANLLKSGKLADVDLEYLIEDLSHEAPPQTDQSCCAYHHLIDYRNAP
ncbi:MAG: DUF29 family protein [Methylococcales bacterium]